jgi:hypothetical protein
MAQSRRWMRGEPPGTAGPQDASPPRPDGAAAAQTRVAPVQKVRVANPGEDEGALEDEDEPAGRAKR